MNKEVLRLLHLRYNDPKTQDTLHLNLTVHHGQALGILESIRNLRVNSVDLIGGTIAYDSGSYLLNGLPVNWTSSKDAEKCGVFIVGRSSRLHEAKSCAENLMILDRGVSSASFIKWKNIDAKAARYIALAGNTGILATQPVSSLTRLQKLILEILKAMTLHASLILLDHIIEAFSQNELSALSSALHALEKQNVDFVITSASLQDLGILTDEILYVRNGTAFRYLQKNELTTSSGGTHSLNKINENDRFPPESIAEVVLQIDGKLNEDDHPFRIQIPGGSLIGIYDSDNTTREILDEQMFMPVDTTQHNLQLTVRGKSFAPKDPGDLIKEGIMQISSLSLANSFDNFDLIDNLTIGMLPQMRIGPFPLISSRVKKYILHTLQNEFNLYGCPLNSNDVSMGLQKLTFEQLLVASFFRCHLMHPSVLIIYRLHLYKDQEHKDIIDRLLDQTLKKNIAILIVSNDPNDTVNKCQTTHLFSNNHYKGISEHAAATSSPISFNHGGRTGIF